MAVYQRANLYQGNILDFVLSSCVFNDEEVRDILISLDPTKAKGPGGICPYVLKFCAIALSILTPVLDQPLNIYIYIIISTEWNFTWWFPFLNQVIKPKLEIRDPFCYNIILCSVSKLFVYQYMINFIRPKISFNQFCFLKNIHVYINLLTSLSICVNAINSKIQVVVKHLTPFLIPHKELLFKLNSFGITGWYVSVT